MRIVVIDGQGGGMGRSIVERLKERLPGAEIIAVGTNATATAQMVRGGGVRGATGENAVVFNCSQADVVIGPVGIYFANSMLAEALAACRAEKFAIPVSRCHIHITGIAEQSLSAHIEEAVSQILQLQNGGN